MSWMVVMGMGAVLGIAALVGIGWSLKKLEAPKKWAALVAFLLVGAGGGFMVANATAIGTVDGDEQEVQEMEDFDAPLDDDWGDEGWGDGEGDDWAEGGGEGEGDDWAEGGGEGDDWAEGAGEEGAGEEGAAEEGAGEEGAGEEGAEAAE